MREEPGTLDLGCGSAKAPGAMGVDVDPSSQADLVHDLNLFPWPLPDDRFIHVRCQDVLEHLEAPLRALLEIHRVSKPGATVSIRTPHYSSWYAYNDPTHRHYFGLFAFDSLLRPGQGPGAPFSLRSRRLEFPRLWRLLGIHRWANRFPHRYEQLFTYLFPAENIRMELRVEK